MYIYYTMISFKTIKLNDTTTIKFKFEMNNVKIQINDMNEYVRYHNEFIQTLSELNLSNFQLKKVRYWYHKNYKKIFPNNEYTTRYGRVIKLDQNH